MEHDRIGAHALLSDCHSAALVDAHGTIDWWCVPRFDSPAVFASLLDDRAGSWTLSPTAMHESDRDYLDDSLVLATTHTTEHGAVRCTDLLATEPGARGHELGLRSPHTLVRRIEGLAGEVELTTELRPRPEYGLHRPRLQRRDGQVLMHAGPMTLHLDTSVDTEIAEAGVSSRFTVREGEVVEFLLRYRPAFSGAAPAGLAEDPVGEAVAAWRSWSALHQSYDGQYQEEVRRSALVLQGLTYQPSGVVVAAATTSLPEEIGGQLNWDYRFAWLRDASLTMQALWVAACPDEPERFFTWLPHAMGEFGDEGVQIMYGIEGERDLSERTLEHLDGYRDSRPVRVGNDAWQQKQLDVLGEVLNAAELLRDQLGAPDEITRRFLVELADRAAASWREPDAGMWESRDRPRHYTSSKVMCWVALDRASRLAEWLGRPDRRDHWRSTADEIHTAVLEEAWSDDAGAIAGAFGSDRLDASVLLLPLVGFIDATDERMAATIEAIAEQLGADGSVTRWKGDTAGFTLCSYWLVECLALTGATDRARRLFEATTAHANDLGLLAEEIDLETGEQLGNFPQAFSHVGLINAAWQLTKTG
jgi:GH15 family glucan-1,4-alpha-glucosidase